MEKNYWLHMWYIHINDFMYDSHVMGHGKLELTFIDF